MAFAVWSGKTSRLLGPAGVDGPAAIYCPNNATVGEIATCVTELTSAITVTEAADNELALVNWIDVCRLFEADSPSLTENVNCREASDPESVGSFAFDPKVTLSSAA